MERIISTSPGSTQLMSSQAFNEIMQMLYKVAISPRGLKIAIHR